MSLAETQAEEDIKKYIDQIKTIYHLFLTFIDNPDLNGDEDYMNLLHFIDTNDIHQNKELFNHFVEILIHIANNHHRQTGFFNKIERILINYKDSIKNDTTDMKIYEQFESNKRLLYFLIKEQILILDDSIKKRIEEKNEFNGLNYYDFFISEVTKNVNNHNSELITYYLNNLDEYNQKRQIGENDSYICSLIRQDSIKEFIEYVNRKSISLLSTIKPSIFETNSFLIDKEPTLIEYAAFFGSIQIFQYLYLNKVKVTGSLWLYGIHSNNSDLLRNYIESNHILPTDETYKEIFIESIKCHHNEIAKYIQNNLINENKMKEKVSNIQITFDEFVFGNAFKYYNYSFFPTEFNQNFAFYYFYKYNYTSIVNILIKSQESIIENRIILINLFKIKLIRLYL